MYLVQIPRPMPSLIPGSQPTCLSVWPFLGVGGGRITPKKRNRRKQESRQWPLTARPISLGHLGGAEWVSVERLRAQLITT